MARRSRSSSSTADRLDEDDRVRARGELVVPVAPIDGGLDEPVSGKSQPPRTWTDPIVLLLVAIAIAGFAFAAGRLTKDAGPRSLQEAQEMVQAGTLPATAGGTATAGTNGAAAGRNGYGGAGGFGGAPGAGAAPPAATPAG